MKAKDIALLCTAAAGAGAAAGAAVSSRSSKDRKKAVPAAKKAAVKTPSLIAVLHEIRLGAENIPCRFFPDGKGAAALSKDGRRAFMIDNKKTVSELRCPSGVTGAAAAEDCVMFINSKGGVTVYNDKDKEPVFCGLTAPEYVCALKDKFCGFSDCLLYICGSGGNIEKTVSLGALIDLPMGDICDAEDSDGSFTLARVSIKKAVSLGSSELAAVLTADGRTFIMNRDEEFCGFEKTYEDIIDLCVFGEFAYYLCRMGGEYGIIKTAISKRTCETSGKYRLCGSEKTPLKIFSAGCGIGVLFEDGSIKLLLPEIKNQAKRERAKSALSAISSAINTVKADDAFCIGEGLGIVCSGRLTVYTAD